MKSELTQKRLRELLHYNPDTGMFTRLIARSGRYGKVGRVAGTKSAKGYIQIKIDDTLYMAHRLAWFYHHDAWPLEFLDHINGNKTDNRLCNLRECTNSENLCNRGMNKNNKLGIKGISYNERDNLYYAKVKKSGAIHCKTFRPLEEAIAWIESMREEIHGDFHNHG